MERKCSGCQINKPHSDFVKATNSKYGISYTCYECKKLQNEKITCDVLKKFQNDICLGKQTWHTKLYEFIINLKNIE